MDTTPHFDNPSPPPRYRHGFLIDPASQVLFDEIPPAPEGYISLTHLDHYARSLYPADYDFASWTWKILLRDTVFFRLMYPGFPVTGRQYQLDIRHITTGQTREEWLDETNDYDALIDPSLWVISTESLKSQYHLLYVHDVRDDGYNRCRDWFYHGKYPSRPTKREAQLFGQPDQVEQARVQGHSACVYALIQRWVLTCL